MKKPVDASSYANFWDTPKHAPKDLYKGCINVGSGKNKRI